MRTEDLAQEYRDIKEAIGIKEGRLEEIKNILMPLAITDGVETKKPGKSGESTTWKMKAGVFFLEVLQSFSALFSKDTFFDLLAEALQDPNQLTFIPDENHRAQLFEVLKLIKDKATTLSQSKKFSVK